MRNIICGLLILHCFNIAFTQNIDSFHHKTIRGGVNTDNAPYEFLSRKGELRGYSIDVLKAVSEASEKQAVFHSGCSGFLMDCLDNDSFEVVVGFYDYGSIKNGYVLSEPFLMDCFNAFTHNRKKDISSISELKNKNVLVEEGSMAEKYLIDNAPFCNLIKVKTSIEALMLLDDNETYDCAVLSNIQGQFIIDEERIMHVKTSDNPLFKLNYCFAALPINKDIIRDINIGLTYIKEKGLLSDINRKWSPQIEEKGFFEKNSKLVFISLLALFLAILATSFLIIYLRMKVNQKTNELEEDLRQKQNSEALLMLHKNEIINKNREIQNQNIELQSRNEKLSKLMEELSLSNKKISEALEMVKQSESRYKEFVEFLPEVVFELNNTGSFQYLNRNGLLTLGLDPDVPYGNISFFDLVHEADRDLVKQYMKQLETNKSYSKGFEYRFWGKEDKLMYFFVIMMAGHDAEGNTNFKGIAIDISSRKIIQEQIRTYADVIERMEMGMYVYKLQFNLHGPELLLSHCNAFSKQFMPKDIINPIGKRLVDIFPALKRDGIYDKYIEVIKTGNTFHLDGYKFELTDGKALYFNFQAFKLGEDTMGVLFEDVTARREMDFEQHLTQYGVAHASDAIFRIRPDGRIVYANLSATNLLGYSRDAFLQMNISEIDPRITLAQWNEWVQILHKKDMVVFETYLRALSGQMMAVEMVLNRVNYQGANVYFAFVRDATDRKKSEELERKIAVTRQAAALKQQFLANMSHEIRTPMTGILGMTSLLLRTKLDDVQSEYVKNIKVSSDALLGIINDVLDLSKIEAGRMDLKPEPVIFRDFCKELNDVFLVNAAQKGLHFSFNVDDDIPEILKIDTLRLRQVIANLLSNAFKFTESGSVTAKFSIQQREGQKVLIKAEIADTGIGISKEDVDKLFSKFTQLDTSLTRKYEGTGLGLAICRELVRLMGGEIGVNSQQGKGSTFYFNFYATYDKDFKINESENEENMDQSLDFNILLVEDKYINRKVIGMMLESFGCSVVMAVNGKEALDIYRPNDFDVVLMDLQMPVMDGITSMKELRKMHIKLVPIIGLSANAMEGDAEKYINEGLDDYISKPFKQEVLFEKLKKWGSIGKNAIE